MIAAANANANAAITAARSEPPPVGRAPLTPAAAVCVVWPPPPPQLLVKDIALGTHVFEELHRQAPRILPAGEVEQLRAVDMSAFLLTWSRERPGVYTG